MKRLTMLLLLCVFFLAGCGAEKQAAEVKLPYLTKEERAELE